MITFTLTFFLAFSVKSEDEIKPTNQSKKSPRDRNKISKKQHSNIILVRPKYVIEVDKIIGTAHIEYELLPKRFKYQIDVICYGSVAKIFTFDGIKSLKTVMIEDNVWVPIYIQHYVNELTTQEILDFCSYTINFTINIDKNKLGKIAKSDKSKLFFSYKKDINADGFVQVFSENPNTYHAEYDRELERDMRNILIDCINYPYNEEIVSWVYFNDIVHEAKINEILMKVEKSLEIDSKNINPIYYQSSKLDMMNKKKNLRKNTNVGKSKKSGKNKNNQKKRDDHKSNKLIIIKVSAEVLFTDPTLTTIDSITENSKIPRIFVLISVDHLLTVLQKFKLNPLVIKILKISNLPSNLLLKYGFKNIYVNCDIPNIINIKTPLKSIEETIQISESRFLCTNTLPKIQLLNFLQTRRIFMEIYGVRDESTDEKPKVHIFGKENNDFNISKKLTATECSNKLNDKSLPPNIVLARAYFDISSLLKNIWIFKEKSPCHNPEVLLYEGELMKNTLNFIDRMTINEINCTLPRGPDIYSPLTEEILTYFGTSLKAEFYFLAPQFIGLYIRESFHIFNRFFIICYDKDIAKTLLNNTLLHNQNIVGAKIFIPNFISKSIKVSLNEAASVEMNLDNVEYKKLITGFMIDNGDSYIFFFEGLFDGYLCTLSHTFHGMNIYQGNVFYNSETVFDERLYDEFVLCGGIFIINLKYPIQEILRRYQVFLEGNMPRPAWRAIRKLDLLLKCNTFKSMLQYNLFPTTHELFGLAMEFGVAYNYSNSDKYE